MKSKKGHKGETKTAVNVPALINQTLLTDIRDLILSARRQVAQAVNAELTMLYWEIGRRIRQDILPHMGELTPLADTMSEEKNSPSSSASLTGFTTADILCATKWRRWTVLRWSKSTGMY